ncbi:hypothetical protein LSH36_473g03078 [Paralvinella palmiformis]|uniref:Uncharacterized protein n=1 Tax=Paralvinella palmiformis TaxID=53620 RepID=A0AAD9JAH3_9ANNE|nr:hypothetical protein LSH36_473g03078 [Paralvinella palmiformis]
MGSACVVLLCRICAKSFSFTDDGPRSGSFFLHLVLTQSLQSNPITSPTPSLHTSSTPSLHSEPRIFRFLIHHLAAELETVHILGSNPPTGIPTEYIHVFAG